MKGAKLLWIGFWVFLVVSFVVSFHIDKGQAQTITGSKHDLSKKQGLSESQICIFCHTPHNARTDLPEVPLWNHGTTVATFVPYSSSTLDATVEQPTGYSKACLSCHDGTVALDTYGVKTGNNFISGSAKLDMDLSNDHPISFIYNAALATKDGGLVFPASEKMVVAGIPLYNTKMECSSCHSVHDQSKGKFLRVDNTGSALCFKCHIK